MFPMISARTSLFAILFAILSGCGSQMPCMGKFMRPGNETMSLSVLGDLTPMHEQWNVPIVDQCREGGSCDSSYMSKTEFGVYPTLSGFIGTDVLRIGVEAGMFVHPSLVLGGRWKRFGWMGWVGYLYNGEEPADWTGGATLAQVVVSKPDWDAGVYEYLALQRYTLIQDLHVLRNPSYHELGIGLWANLGKIRGASLEARVGRDFTNGRMKAYLGCSVDFGSRFDQE